MMLILWRLLKEGRIPRVSMIMDSPMGASVLELFHRTRDWHRLGALECEEMCAAFKVVSSFRETIELRDDNVPKIVIAGSGMLTGGRMLNYMEKQASNAKNTLLFIGYQAEGTRGRKLLEGVRELMVYGKTVPFNMNVVEMEGLSAHGDHTELLDWLSDIKVPPERTYIVHGEAESALALKKGIEEEYYWECQIPKLYDIKEIRMS